MKITVLTLFPQLLEPFLKTSILGRAIKEKKITVYPVDLRAFAEDKHQTVDDTPYGGGPGMVLKVDVIDRAIDQVKRSNRGEQITTILLEASGHTFTQGRAEHLSHHQHLLLISGHYEGVDERVRKLVDEVLSIGDYVLTGGELPALVVIDAVTRLLPGVLGNEASRLEESFTFRDPSTKGRLLEYPTYTKPEHFKNMSVPKILLQGDHQAIKAWRLEHARKRTKQYRRKRPLKEL